MITSIPLSLESLAAQIGAIDKRLSEVCSWMQRLDERYYTTIYGNGKPGMRAEVDLLKNNDVHRTEKERVRDRKEWAMVVGIVLLLLEQGIRLL